MHQWQPAAAIQMPDLRDQAVREETLSRDLTRELIRELTRDLTRELTRDLTRVEHPETSLM